eukprot:4465222-Prymnesium_polylepis.1
MLPARECCPHAREQGRANKVRSSLVGRGVCAHSPRCASTARVCVRAPQPSLIWCANFALLVTCYAAALAIGDGAEEAGGFSGALRWLDFGSGQERGMTASAREKYAAKQAAAREAEKQEAEKVES